MTRIALLTAVCGLALAACSGPDTATDEDDVVEQPTDRPSAEMTEDEAARIDPRVQAERQQAEAVAAIVAEARACDLPADTEIVLVGPPEGPIQADANAEASEAYIASVLEQECVFELPSGLVFRIVDAEQEGLSPMPGDLVTVHYRGQLPHGEVFDSSYDRGQPETFPSDRLIRGWVEALPLMHVGESWELYLRPRLGYGERGTPDGPIGPNQALIFEMELLDVPSAADRQ
ncbi:FKBP-type peptidyl-prolyl cis-trans isomerase [Maricaulis sp. CAU 1757]